MVTIIFVLIEFFNVKVSLFFIIFNPVVCFLLVVIGLFIVVCGLFYLSFFFSLLFLLG